MRKVLWLLTLSPGLAFAQTPKDVPFPKPRPVVDILKPTNPLAPKPRPAQLSTKISTPAPSNLQGSVCGRASIKGQPQAAITGRIKACGISKPVKVTQVSGVALEPAAIVNCKTAQALDIWVKRSVKPAFAANGGVRKLRVAASYSCRPRNNKPGAKLSEHSYGNAIDISAFDLANGRRATVLNGWRSKAYGPALRRVHKGACGPFGTVLGPDADRYHKDHFHFDVASYRSGAYCR